MAEWSDHLIVAPILVPLAASGRCYCSMSRGGG